MNESNCQRKYNGRNKKQYNDNDNQPNYEKVKGDYNIELLKVIVQFPVVDLGAQFTDRGIPFYCPFHSNFDYLLHKQKCDDFFKDFNCVYEHNNGNKVIYKTCDDFKDHCRKNGDFYHRCLLHFFVSLYDPQPEQIFNFNQILIQTKLWNQIIITMEKELQECPIIPIGKNEKHI